MIVRTGLGTNSGLISSGVSVVGGSVAAAASAGLLTTIGITAAAVPIIGPIIAGVALLIGVLGIGNGCGGTCTEATQVVNQAEPALQQNLEAAKATVAANGCLTSAEQAQCVANFNTVWSQVESQCGQIPAPGGTQCIGDRKAGGKLDWTAMYLTPIMDMPICDSSNLGGSSLGSISPLLLIGGGVLLLGLLLGGD